MSADREVLERLGPFVEREGGAPEGWEARIALFLRMLTERNRSVNLVSRRTGGEALERHVLPSLAALRLVPPAQPMRVLDVGSGGGFPGIPLKILRPEARVDLVEATRKKCRFLQECVRRLDLGDTRVYWTRVERPSEELRARAPFDCIVARAFGDEELLARAGRPLLAPEGTIWVFAAPGDPRSEPWGVWGGRAVAVTGLRRIGGRDA